MDIAANMLAPASSAGIRALSLDNIKRAAPQSHKWAAAGAVGAGTDQFPFYNLITDTAESGATLGTPTVSAGGWSVAQVTRYIADNPAPLRNMHFTGAAGGSASTLLENGTLRFLRSSPDVSVQQETIPLSTFVSADRYQTSVLSVPINGEVLDGYTFARVLTPQHGVTANSYVLTFNFGATEDRRASVPPASAAVISGR